MADNTTLWLLAGVGLGVGLAAGAWWLSQRSDGPTRLSGQSEPLVRQHVVQRNEQGLISSVETTTFPSVGGQQRQLADGDIEIVQDG